MKNIIFFLLIFSVFFTGCKLKESKQQEPKLIVGIVIDQMRYDYLTRFSDRYSENGFKRLLKNGFSIENAYYNLIPTYTAVGHASIYTGTTPDNHGIISNNWYDKFLKKTIYCVDDDIYRTVGNNSDAGKKSPSRMYTTTVTDQLHLAQNMNGKTIGIAIKDRSAILPAGHTANAAYWFHGKQKGQWISSNFYMENLPNWVTDFNNSDKANNYLKTPWNTLYNINTYTNSIIDNNLFEGKFKGETATSFPHDIPNLKVTNGNFDILKGIPAGNSFTADFAKAAILGENLGKSEFTDFLAVSFSSTDYIGHQFGPASKEIEDTYLRLDKDIADLLSFLDKQIGKNKYTVFLTADHAAVDVPAYLQSLKIPAHYFDIQKFKQSALEITKKYFNSIELIENISNYQIFLNKQKIESLGLDKNKVADKLVEEILNFEGIYKAVTARTLQTTRFFDGIMNSLQNGYNQKISGDVMMIPYPATLIRGRTGTSHGSGYSYDTHIPLIFYGNGIKKGVSKSKYEIIDIAPTIANLLRIEAPNSSTGKIITEALK
ncbi:MULTISPECIES: alkaline phosphatase PafA [unclassified Polaribacter]|jgi:predicted AlkP superfamily pyrophosphatase or phosphodiesterase|uniref:alkaline phosphatase PafA n=1 Tax=unclassified Polaribacter TaxID=196858 RepID=UPI00052C32BC|nr:MULTISPECIES: alkaline phosphatase PafA [unclassified Polaribacter]KGL59688.1 type I phosphodiesterase/nucleotide pyrophosphatase precursor [Polaribacter sp. Hel1_33_49]PKV64181.1 type I phosphodiesterase/nucleotide pyrophosphatase [Polaribacter sp. Hel1_33_96]